VIFNPQQGYHFESVASFTDYAVNSDRGTIEKLNPPDSIKLHGESSRIGEFMKNARRELQFVPAQ
jgi:hypothetical protein